jgi:predicted metalloprotease
MPLNYADEDGLELQADCLAGVWINSAYHEGQLKSGDFEQAMNLAALLGDDATGFPSDIAPKAIHGQSAERQQWLKAGYDTGDPRKCAELQV